MDSLPGRVKSTKTMEGNIWVESFTGSEERRELEKRDAGNVALIANFTINVAMKYHSR